MYKQAGRLKLRFQTVRGFLTSEQLWDLNLPELAMAIKAYKKVLNKDDDDELSFLESTRPADLEAQLRFEILKDVYITKKKEMESAAAALEAKQHNQLIYAKMAALKEKSLDGMTMEELEKQLK